MATPERLSPVRRCLFERATQSETDDYLDEELRRISEHKNATWNFDFKKDQPQPGAWQWERIDVATNATATDIKPIDRVGEIAARPDDKAPAVAVTESRPSPRRSDRQRNAREGSDGDETTASRRGTLALSTTVERRRSPRRRKATADAATETTTNNGDIRACMPVVKRPRTRADARASRKKVPAPVRKSPRFSTLNK